MEACQVYNKAVLIFDEYSLHDVPNDELRLRNAGNLKAIRELTTRRDAQNKIREELRGTFGEAAVEQYNILRCSNKLRDGTMTPAYQRLSNFEKKLYSDNGELKEEFRGNKRIESVAEAIAALPRVVENGKAGGDFIKPRQYEWLQELLLKLRLPSEEHTASAVCMFG